MARATHDPGRRPNPRRFARQLHAGSQPDSHSRRRQGCHPLPNLGHCPATAHRVACAAPRMTFQRMATAPLQHQSGGPAVATDMFKPARVRVPGRAAALNRQHALALWQIAQQPSQGFGQVLPRHQAAAHRAIGVGYGNLMLMRRDKPRWRLWLRAKPGMESIVVVVQVGSTRRRHHQHSGSKSSLLAPFKCGLQWVPQPVGEGVRLFASGN